MIHKLMINSRFFKWRFDGYHELHEYIEPIHIIFKLIWKEKDKEI